jgi:formyltetrahydrofolate-dependent phosphoribosylglycinamide formyltransferase
MAKLKIGVLISGRGSNMAALIEAARASDYPAEIACVVSNTADAGGVATAKAAGIETSVVPHRSFPDRETFDRAISAVLEKHGVGLVVLAGFMRIFSPWFPQHWASRIVNIHPSLLPLYKGLDTHRRAIEAGDAEAGCSVHLVTPALDDGEVLARARVPLRPGDTAATLAARVLAEEHRLYPATIAAYIRDHD